MSAAGLLLLALACAPKPAPPVAAVPPAPAAVAEPDAAELIYFVLVDRYANGDPANDQASPGPAADPADPQAWHGGDLAGVRQHLDELRGLGVTTLWLSPVFRTRTEPIGGWGAFHGYWQWDPMQVEPRFGDAQDLQALAQGLRDRGMGLMLDLVTNHVGYDAPLLATHPDWFHQQGTIEDWGDRRQLEDGQVHGLPDLDQDQPEVAAWLHEAARHWQETLDLRGYRVDAVRHVPNEFLAGLGQAVRARRADAWWLGEDFTGDVAELAQSQRTGGFTHVFDFPLYYAMTDVFCDDAAPSRLASVLWQDRLYDRPEGLVTFLDNHDLPRIRTRCHDDAGRLGRALIFQMLSRGVPALTYGTEAGLQGGEEPHNRGDMVFGRTLLGDYIARLAELRQAHPALRGGVQRVVDLGPDHVVVARVAGEDAVLVAVNRADHAVAVPVPEALAGGMVVHRLEQAGDGALTTVAMPGGVSWREVGPEVPAHGLRAWLVEGAGPLAATGPEVPVALRATGLPADAAQVVVVGAGPALGHWDPARGVPLQRDGEAWTGVLEAPEGAVLEGKLVILGPEGPRWADGENAALLVGASDAWPLSW